MKSIQWKLDHFQILIEKDIVSTLKDLNLV